MTYKNALATETSPYLLQHADNPVYWYPWGEEALHKAKQENKPILLSIGYSACHWCHVMAHESFEDETTAELMNQHFINIKVDREERPDLDKIYQTAHHMLTQRSGGWPLTMILSPHDHVPFFGGTYFPKTPRYGMTSFTELLGKLVGYYHEKADVIHQQNERLSNALGQFYTSPTHEGMLDTALLDQARAELQQAFDPKQGGFGTAPKFPHSGNLERLLRHWDGTAKEDKEALRVATFSLEKMARGGMTDQLGGGFCRYSVDDQWMIPHFEKMLYDNGVLLPLYAQAYAATNNPYFQAVSHQTAQWVMREMQSTEGGYYSAYDADSEGEEGKFYVWDKAEVQALLSDDEYAVIANKYGLHRKANFEGRWNFHDYHASAALAKQLGKDEATIDALLASAKSTLLTTRNQRVWPARDDKILTAWNALMIKGMAITARHLACPEYAQSASRALDFIRATLWQEDKLLATYKDGKAHLNAYLDDYAFLLDAVLELLQVRWRSDELQFALQLADYLLDHFEDKQRGGFWFVANDHEQLIQRPKTYQDDAIPNGNGIAAYALARLGYLVGDTRYLVAAERVIESGLGAVTQSPIGHCSMLLALEEKVLPPKTVIVRGRQEKALSDSAYQPRQQLYFIPNDAENLPAALAEKQVTDKTTAYICEGTTCLPPQILPDDMQQV